MKIWLKLLASYLVIICATILLSYLGIQSAIQVRDGFRRVNGDIIPLVQALKDLRFAGVRIVASTMEYSFVAAMMEKQSGDLEHHHEEEKQEEITLIAQGKHDFETELAVCEICLLTKPGREAEYRELEDASRQFMGAADAFFRLIAADTSPELLLAAKENFEQNEMQFLAVVAKKHDQELSKLKSYEKRAFSTVASAFDTIRICSLLAFAVSLFIGVKTTYSITRRLNFLKKATHAVAAGKRDTVLPITSHDEITSVSRSFNVMVNALRASEADLASTNKYLESIIATMPEALVVVSVTGVILDTNPAIREVLGFEPERLIGHPFVELFRGRGEGEKFCRTAAISQVRVGQEYLFATAAGGEIHVQLLATPLSSQERQESSFLCLIQDISPRKRAEKDIHKLAYFDLLTGLPNRTLFFDRCTQALAHAERNREFLALLFLDLDHFKDINDTLGHQAGDLLLQLVVKRITTEIRASDTLARFGGDEFAMLCTSARNPERLAWLAESIVQRLNEPFEIAGRQIHTSVSIGIAIYPEDGRDIGTLMSNSDLAMYAAKEGGRRHFRFFSDDLTVKAQERADIGAGLRQALQNEELTVHYQPQIQLQTGRVIGMEALLRWNHPLMGPISPERFIPVAEQTGQIKELGEWVLRTACRQCRKWHAEGHLLTMGVNVSTLQLMHPGFPELVAAALRESGLPPEYLDLELTESILMENAAESAVILTQMKAMGVKISIDDFGTGYSSLSYLKNFAVDRLKIDWSFVSELTSRADSAAIIEAIVAIGHGLGLSVIAEGVESLKEEEMLMHYKCDEVQGYFYAKAMPSAEAGRYLSQGE